MKKELDVPIHKNIKVQKSEENLKNINRLRT